MNSVTEDLKIVDKERGYKMTKINTVYYRVPVNCDQCGSPMRVKKPWRIDGYSYNEGQPDSYEAIISCSKKRWWTFGYHREYFLFFTPKQYNALSRNKHGLTLLELE